MFAATLIGFLGFLALLLYLGLSIPSLLLKLFLLLVGIFAWTVRTLFSAAVFFFDFFAAFIGSTPGQRKILRQNQAKREQEKDPSYARRQYAARTSAQSTEELLTKNYPYADKELFGELALCIHREEYDRISAISEKIKASHISKVPQTVLSTASVQQELYGYEDVKDLLPVQQRTKNGVTCDIRELNNVFIILAQRKGVEAKRLFQTDAFYKAMEALPIAIKIMGRYHEKETLSEWIGDDFWIRYRRWLKNSRFICMEGERN